MKESLEATLKDVELTKEVYRLYTLEHLTQQGNYSAPLWA